MKHKYYVPATRSQPHLNVGIAWMWVLTNRLYDVPGWGNGVFWTLWLILLAVNITGIIIRKPYDEQKMDRILGDD